MLICFSFLLLFDLLFPRRGGICICVLYFQTGLSTWNCPPLPMNGYGHKIRPPTPTPTPTKRQNLSSQNKTKTGISTWNCAALPKNGGGPKIRPPPPTPTKQKYKTSHNVEKKEVISSQLQKRQKLQYWKLCCFTQIINHHSILRSTARANIFQYSKPIFQVLQSPEFWGI